VRRNTPILGSLAIVAFLTAGCVTLSGTYERPDPRPAIPEGGILVLTLDADGFYTMTRTGPAPRTTTGTYEAAGQTLTLREKNGATRTYRFEQKHGDLLLTPIEAPESPGIVVRLVRTSP
jgi:hypothetical protein